MLPFFASSIFNSHINYQTTLRLLLDFMLDFDSWTLEKIQAVWSFTSINVIVKKQSE